MRETSLGRCAWQESPTVRCVSCMRSGCILFHNFRADGCVCHFAISDLYPSHKLVIDPLHKERNEAPMLHTQLVIGKGCWTDCLFVC